MTNLKEQNNNRIRSFDQLSAPLDFYFADVTDPKSGRSIQKREMERAWFASGQVVTASKDDFKRGNNRGIFSTDTNYINFKNELNLEGNKNWQPNIDQNGFARGEPIVSTFDALAATTGVPMFPLHIPPADNTPRRESMDLNTDFENEHHKRIFDALFDLMFGTYNPASYRIAKISSTTFPIFAQGEESYEFKMSLAHAILRDMDEILDCVAKGKWEDLRDKWYIVMCYRLSTRSQPDKRGKKRKVQNKDGDEITADKTGWLHSNVGVVDAEAMRIRTVFGLCAAINYLMSFFFSCRRSHYFKEYEFTWHHTGPDQLLTALKQFVTVVGVDVTLMDQTVPHYFLERYANRTESVMDPRFAKLVSLVNGAPYYAPAIAPGMENFFMGDPADPSTWDIHVGLASGRADNPDLGKFWMTFVYITMMDEALPLYPRTDISREAYLKVTDDFLKGRHPIWGLQDMGDDGIFGCKSESADIAIRKLLAKEQPSNYVSVDVEDGISFLGMVVYKDEAGVLKRPAPNPVTFLVNRLCPERGIYSPMRKFWGAGMKSATDHYRAAGPIINDVIDLTKEIWYKHFEYPDPFINAADHAEKFPVNGNGLSAAESEVLLDNSKIWYKFSPDEISDEVLNTFSWSVDAEIIDKSIQHLNSNVDLSCLGTKWIDYKQLTRGLS